MYSCVLAARASAIWLKSPAREVTSSGPETLGRALRSPAVMALALARSEARGRTTETMSTATVPAVTRKAATLEPTRSQRVVAAARSAATVLAASSCCSLLAISWRSATMASDSDHISDLPAVANCSLVSGSAWSRIGRVESTVALKLAIRSVTSSRARSSFASPLARTSARAWLRCCSIAAAASW
jgi:hypothetical protein